MFISPRHYDVSLAEAERIQKKVQEERILSLHGKKEVDSTENLSESAGL